jgi:DNA-binding MarR family transcriptional regulator
VTARGESLRSIEREVGVLIRRARRTIRERARAVHPDLQAATYLLLLHLAETGPLRASAVVESVGIDKAAISRQTQHLVELGLLTRAPDPTDGRAMLLSVTDDAHERLARVQQARSARFGRRLEGWTDEQLAAFGAELGRYNVALEPVDGDGR